MRSVVSLHERFQGCLDRRWQEQTKGSGRTRVTAQGLRLINSGTSRDHYSNAQIDDYQHLRRRHFPWQPPLRLLVRARFSHPGTRQPDGADSLCGTAGFGFWNDPFLMTSWRLPALPRAIWFFYASPPSDMKLDVKTPGWGWKAATIDAARAPFAAMLPLAPLALPLMHVEPIYRTLWPLAQGAMNISERLLSLSMTDWHIYTIEWGARTARFLVDGVPHLVCRTPPRGPLGLVIWKDNQFMQVTPQGRIRHGLVGCPEDQWMEIDWLVVESN